MIDHQRDGEAMIWSSGMFNEDKPKYVAIADAIGVAVRDGRLSPGARLPTHRELARELGVTVGTITRAYAEARDRGILSGEVGRGTFVRERPGEPMRFVWSDGAGPAGIDLSLNFPMTVSAENETIRAALSAIVAETNLVEHVSGPWPRIEPRMQTIGAAWLARQGIETAPEQVLISTGFQSAVWSILSTFTSPGDLLLTESVTGTGIKALANQLHLRLHGVPMDRFGVRPDSLDAVCRQSKAKFLHVQPSIQNPSTCSMPQARRRELIEVAQRHDLLIIEDDEHRILLDYEVSALASIDPDRVFFVADLGRALTTGVRVCFVAAPKSKVDDLNVGVTTTTWFVPPLIAELAARLIESGAADTLVRERRRGVAARVKLACDVLGAESIQSHQYGHHVWMKLPEPWRSERFVVEAEAHGVRIAGGADFAVGPSTTPPAVRVCLGAAADEATLENGLRVLAGLRDGGPDAG